MRNIKGFHVGDVRVKKLTPASKMCDRSPLGVMLNFDARDKNSDAAQPRVTNVKTPIGCKTFTMHREDRARRDQGLCTPTPGSTPNLKDGPVPTGPVPHGERQQKTTRSSAQGNCSAKSLAVSVMSPILPCSSIIPCPPCLPPVMLSTGGLPPAGGSHLQQEGSCLWWGGEGGLGGRGPGDKSVQLPYTALSHGASP